MFVVITEGHYLEELGKLAQAQVLMLVSKVSNIITSIKVAC